MPLLLKIVFASLISGLLGLVGGITLLIKVNWVKRVSIYLISFAVGVLLSTAILDLLPEAVEFAGEHPEGIFLGLLLGIVGFFGLERMIFKFHPHHHEDIDHHHAAPTLLLIGDTVHNFIDGILITVTFLANPGLGILTAVAIAAHEIPQEIGDFSVMLHHGWSKTKVFWGNILSACASLVGALAAYALKDLATAHIPFLLAFTSGIFIYIAVADLIPEVTVKSLKDKTYSVLFLLGLGILAVWFLGTLLEAH